MGLVKGVMTLAEAIKLWISENKQQADTLVSLGIPLTVDLLTEKKYRDVRIDDSLPDGWTKVHVIDSKYCRTVGELQDAVEKFYSNNYPL